MSYSAYQPQPYGSNNAYEAGQVQQGGYGYGSSNPYGTSSGGQYNAQQGYTSGGYQQGYSDSQQPPQQYASGGVMSDQDFLARVEAVKGDIRQLTSNIGEIGAIHQRVLGTPDSSASAQLENIVSQTQVLNTKIKDQIKQLEYDAAKSGNNRTKDSQIRSLKGNFRSQLEEYQKEETTYKQRYRDQIARQYRIVNPDASEQEVQQATQADWGDEGVFQTALKSNRSGAANSVLGSVRARHNDIQQIEKTLIELNQIFTELAEQVILQEEPIKQNEEVTSNVLKDTEQGNQHLTRGVASAARARKLKWWAFGIIVAILIIIAIIVAVVVTTLNNK